MPRQRHKPTEKQIGEATAYAVVGVPHHDIARLLGVSIKTLLKYYRDEMDMGKVRANAQVAKSLFSSATSGNLGAQCFWLKCQAGWRETQIVNVNMGGQPGNPIEIKAECSVEEATRAYNDLIG